MVDTFVAPGLLDDMVLVCGWLGKGSRARCWKWWGVKSGVDEM